MSQTEATLNRSLQAIADASRRRILRALKERGGNALGKEAGLCASDIEQRISLTQPTVSHHMAVLTRAGLVQAKKIGQWVWYQRNEKALKALTDDLRQSL
jgi:DNA-binding transcriptional ArsR family regulator